MSNRISENSTGFQAGNDLTINIGLAVDEVDKLVNIFLEREFPKLEAMALEKFKANGKLFQDQLEKKIADRIKKLNLNNFGDPDVQYSIREATIEVGKKGRKANIDILADLVVNKLEEDHSDLGSLVLSEAIKITPKLTSKQIDFLTTIYSVTNTQLKTFKEVKDYDPIFEKFNHLLENSKDISNYNLLYLEDLNCLFPPAFLDMKDAYRALCEMQVEISKLSKHDFEKQISETIYFKKFIDFMTKKHLFGYKLSIPGQLIATTRLQQIIPNFSLIEFIK